MKKYISKILNIAFAGILLFMLAQKIPLWLSNSKSEGQQAPLASVKLLNGDSLQIPMAKSHAIIFWATWCAPCSVELARIQAMIDRGSLKPESIIAISWGEDKKTVEEVVKEKGYTFLVATDEKADAAKIYEVVATPTLVLVDDQGKVKWKTTGLSASLEARLRDL
ncbi:MAG: TlpA family protein disulfide reductase [Oligoflexia bacterium]|nr:TlpA family protein disulfide reductase [Oligoflexia bacterium]